MVLCSSSPSLVSSTCTKFPPPVYSTDKRSQTSCASCPPETRKPMEWLWSTEQARFLPSMLKKRIWFHTSTQLGILLTIKLFPSNLPRDSTCLEPMKFSNSSSRARLLLLIMQELPLLPEMLQVPFWETKRPLTSSRTSLRLEAQLQFWFTSTLSFKPQNSMPLNLWSSQDQWLPKTNWIWSRTGSKKVSWQWLTSLEISSNWPIHNWRSTSTSNLALQTKLSKDWFKQTNLIKSCHIVRRQDIFQTSSQSWDRSCQRTLKQLLAWPKWLPTETLVLQRHKLIW